LKLLFYLIRLEMKRQDFRILVKFSNLLIHIHTLKLNLIY